MIRQAASLLLLTAVVALPSCKSSDKTPAPSTQPGAMGSSDSSREVHVEPGVAGGVIEETDTVTATVKSIDVVGRHITLVGEDGQTAGFTAGPEIRNFDQFHVGDKLTATLKQRLVVFVRKGGEEASATYAAAVAAAPKGAKPGALVGESYEVIATVTAIDPKARTATLKFVDGKTRTVKVRDDVDMNRYKTGDAVVIRVTTALGVLVSKPK